MKDKLVEKLFSSDYDEILDTLTQIEKNNIFDTNTLKNVLHIYKTLHNRMIREKITNLLKKANNNEIVQDIINLFSESDPFLRNAAIEILQSKGEDVVDLLYDAMNNDDRDIRKLVVDTAAKIHSPKIAKIFEKAFEDSDINVVIAAVEYCANLELVSLREKILNILLNSSDDFLSSVCLETLSVIGNEEVLKIIKKDLFVNNSVKDILLFPFLKLLGNFGNEDDLDWIAKNDIDFEKYFKELIDAVQGVMERENLTTIPDLFFDEFKKLVFSPTIKSLGKYDIITFLSNFDNSKTTEFLHEVLKLDDKMVLMGAIEVIADNGWGKDFIDELERIKEEFAEDEEISELIADIIDMEE